MRRAALFTQMAVLMTAVGAFFFSIAYGGIIIVVIAISATFQAAVANKAKQARLRPRKMLDDGVHASSPPRSLLGLIARSLVSPGSGRRRLQIAKIWARMARWFSKVVPPSFANL